jgi:hypothetical protein
VPSANPATPSPRAAPRETPSKMSYQRLREMAEAAQQREGGAMVLTVPKKRPVGDRAALLPGLIGKVVAYDGVRATLYLRATDVLAWLDRHAPRDATEASHV